MTDAIELNQKVEDMEDFHDESRFSILKKKLGFKAAIAGTGALSLAGAASANATTIDWTGLKEIIEGAASIFPSIGTMVIEIVPVIIMLAIVGFVIMFFDKILDAISAAFKIFR